MDWGVNTGANCCGPLGEGGTHSCEEAGLVRGCGKHGRKVKAKGVAAKFFAACAVVIFHARRMRA